MSVHEAPITIHTIDLSPNYLALSYQLNRFDPQLAASDLSTLRLLGTVSLVKENEDPSLKVDSTCPVELGVGGEQQPLVVHGKRLTELDV